jgi:predicted nuclease with TOPRIM domain
MENKRIATEVIRITKEQKSFLEIMKNKDDPIHEAVEELIKTYIEYQEKKDEYKAKLNSVLDRIQDLEGKYKQLQDRGLIE